MDAVIQKIEFFDIYKNNINKTIIQKSEFKKLLKKWPEIKGLGEKMDFVSVCNGNIKSHKMIKIINI